MDRYSRADRVDRILFAAMLLASLALCVFGVIDIVRADPLPVPDRVRDGAQNFCITWAQQALGGAKKHLQNSHDMRPKDLTVIFQTRAEDAADPNNYAHLIINDEDVPTAFVLLTGNYENGDQWELSDAGRVWIADALRGGWLWARLEIGRRGEGALRAISRDQAVHDLYDYCLGAKEVRRRGTFIGDDPDWPLEQGEPTGGTASWRDCPQENEDGSCTVSLRRIASNERVRLPLEQAIANAKREHCIDVGMSADEVMGRRANGQTIESLTIELDEAKISAAQRADQAELLAAAYAWKGTRVEFVHQTYESCMK